MYKIIIGFFIFNDSGKLVKISYLIQKPENFKNKIVFVKGEITRVCEGSGCWIEIKEGENKIIAKSLDHKILFPKDFLGKKVEIKGILREKIKEGEKCYVHKESGEKSHKCPKPEYFIEIKEAKIKEE